ncbi:hypothetical protein I4F81_007765 [Pyropia yezoensis]|uniref:Uncharacterized protein n=1 Tax=Pyropia yezoensis TaxID=2788 RepID=A0ACC3C4N3_PYRYE|nr:hypothetical protein I4F81_007765 [Neopyropia yezoensis]
MQGQGNFANAPSVTYLGALARLMLASQGIREGCVPRGCGFPGCRPTPTCARCYDSAFPVARPFGAAGTDILTMGAEHRGWVHHASAFVLAPPFAGAHVRASVCRVLPDRVGGPSLHTETRRFSLRCRPSRGTVSSRDARRRFFPAMRAEQRSLPDDVAAAVDADYVPSVDFLRRFWDAARTVMWRASEMAESEAGFMAAAAGDGDWDRSAASKSRQMRLLARRLGDLVSQAKRLPSLCSNRPAAIGEAVSLCGALYYVLEQDKLALLGEAADRTATAAFGASPLLDLVVRERLDHVADCFEEAEDKVRDVLPILLGTLDELQVLFFLFSPMAASLTPSERLPPGRQRSPGSTLSLEPPRDDAVCIRRDAQVVRLLAHLSVMQEGVRAASFVASSPGMGKSHLVWDVLEAFQGLDDPRYADAAERTGFPLWSDVVNNLQGVRACVVTFNSSSKWDKRDLDIVDQCSSHPDGVLLPIYLRLLWFFRCANTVPWEGFMVRAAANVRDKVITVDGIVAEAIRALREQPTVIIVEEISKVTGFVPVRPEPTPAQREWSTYEDGEANGARQPLDEQRKTQTLFSLYRHEFCVLTGMGGASVTILFTSPSFGGVMFADVQDDLTDDMIERAGSLSTMLKNFGMPDMGVQKAILSSKSSTRPGSPFFVLCAAELDFLGADDVAAAYFLPWFQSRFRIRMSLPCRGSHVLPADTAAKAFASLSGGHPRSAAFLRRVLKNVTPGQVSSSVVTPAVTDLFDREDSTVAPLLVGMFVMPVVIVAAVHACDVDCRQPISNHSTAPGPCASWNDLVTSNALTAAVADSSGKVKNPSMPPLYLLALLYHWQQNKSKEVMPVADKELVARLKGILDALLHVVGANDSRGSADKVWEYVSMYSDVALTRVREAALTWCGASPGISLPHDYTAVTLRALYPGTQVYSTPGKFPLLDSRLYDATRSLHVDENEKANSMESILCRSATELSSTVYKCQPQQFGFDSIKFLSPSGSSKPPSKHELVAVCKSSKFTGLASGQLTVKGQVRKSLDLLPIAFNTAFDNAWKEWSDRVVLVVETNLKAAKTSGKVLSAEESAMVIIITVETHVEVYGRAISGFISHGPSLYGAMIEAIDAPIPDADGDGDR